MVDRLERSMFPRGSHLITDDFELDPYFTAIDERAVIGGNLDTPSSPAGEVAYSSPLLHHHQ